MTYQKKVEWLKSYQIIDAKIGSLTDELQVWNNRTTKITTSFSSEPKAAGGGDQLQKCVDKICELQEELAREMQLLQSRRQEIERAINTLEDERFRSVLQLKYIEGMTFEEVADKIPYSCRQVHRIHKTAIEKIKMS